MIANTSLQAFSVPDRTARTGSAGQTDTTSRTGQTDAPTRAETTGISAAPPTATRGSLLDRWA